MAKIFISIASYRDPELLPTIKDILEKAKKPKDLRICIAWQHSEEDSWDQLDEYKNDSRFDIIDIPYKQSLGTCWARNQIHQRYNGEDYYLQLDSHHRFIENWDQECIKMVKGLQKKGHSKPLLTAYIPSFNPEKDPQDRVQEPWWMTFDRFIPEGAVFFLPASIPNWKELKEPIPSRFLSAHFIFTLGKWCQEVTYDPNYYFHGEEISLAVRSYTSGYDLFHPHKVVAWHEYTRKGRTKQWDDDPEWVTKNNNSHKRNRILFGMEPGCSECQRKSVKQYGFGNERTLENYERYAGIQFSTRAAQDYTLNNNFAPNPIIEDPEEYAKSFKKIFKHCIDVYPISLHERDYDFWCVAFENDQGDTIHRQDADVDELNRIFADNEFGYYKVWRTFETSQKPVKWVIWPHSATKGWCDKMEGIIV